MPELPEVETVVRQLSSILLKQRMKEVCLYDEKLGVLPSFPYSSARVSLVRRLGKQVVVAFAPADRSESAFFLVVHLRMTGRLLWHPKMGPTAVKSIPAFHYVNEQGNSNDRKHRRARIVFEEGELDFVDVRRFGTFEFEADLRRHLPQGIDPLTDAFRLEELTRLLADSKQTMKQWLLRQDKLVGLGNIYVCEILFRTQLHPGRIAATLTSKEVSRLYQVIPELLTQAIMHCGTTFSDFQNTDGVAGGFQEFLQVYQKEGQPCVVCGHPILRMSQQGRSSFFCSNCQV